MRQIFMFDSILFLIWYPGWTEEKYDALEKIQEKSIKVAYPNLLCDEVLTNVIFPL